MLTKYNELESKLELEMPSHEHQIMKVAHHMLKESIANKTRDVRRRMREMQRYQ